jgi:hypothetical protein
LGEDASPIVRRATIDEIGTVDDNLLTAFMCDKGVTKNSRIPLDVSGEALKDREPDDVRIEFERVMEIKFLVNSACQNAWLIKKAIAGTSSSGTYEATGNRR